MRRQVLIVGGGLAGMTAARELRKAGLDVEILESSYRLGGKAGAETVTPDGKLVDHGYHVFPPWYANVRGLLKEIGIEGNLIDLHRFYYVRKGDEQKDWVEFRDVSSPRDLLWNVFRGIGDWPEMMLTFYALLQLANEPFRYRSFLDRTSLSGFLRSRPFMTEGIAELQHHTVLQGSSIPAYEVSAMTMQRVARAWIRYPSPLYSIMNGDLQSRFIKPFEDRILADGVKVSLNKRVAELVVPNGRVTSLKLDDGTSVGDSQAIYVVTTPHEVTVEFVNPEIFAAEAGEFPSEVKALSDLYGLRSAPMAALHLSLKKTLDLPSEHIVLYKSRFLTSFIDLAKNWRLRNSELSIIASDFTALETLTDDDPNAPDIGSIGHPAAQAVIDELLEFVPTIKREDIDESLSFAIFNVRKQLFLNTVGAWPFRPVTKTRLENLFVAGDYCQTQADITTMESAVISGLNTAAAILESEGLPNEVRIESLRNDAGWNPFKSYPRIPMRVVEYAAAPLVAALFAGWGVWEAIRGNEETA